MRLTVSIWPSAVRCMITRCRPSPFTAPLQKQSLKIVRLSLTICIFPQTQRSCCAPAQIRKFTATRSRSLFSLLQNRLFQTISNPALTMSPLMQVLLSRLTRCRKGQTATHRQTWSLFQIRDIRHLPTLTVQTDGTCPMRKNTAISRILPRVGAGRSFLFPFTPGKSGADRNCEHIQRPCYYQIHSPGSWCAMPCHCPTHAKRPHSS